MPSIYKLIVTAFLTLEVISGYRNMFGSRPQLKGRKFRNREFGSLEAAYDFFSRVKARKPFVSEIHVLPQVHMIKGNSPSLFTPNFPVSSTFHKSNKFNTKDTHKGKDNFLEKAAKLKTKRPLVHLLNRADSDIGKALDKYMKKAEVTRVTEVVEKQSSSVPVGKLGPVLVNEVPLMKESFPIPMLKSELQPLGPGPYRFCYEPSVVICGARLPWGHVPGMSDWCENNCDKEAYTRHCDDARCTCKCLKPGELF